MGLREMVKSAISNLPTPSQVFEGASSKVSQAIGDIGHSVGNAFNTIQTTVGLKGIMPAIGTMSANISSLSLAILGAVPTMGSMKFLEGNLNSQMLDKLQLMQLSEDLKKQLELLLKSMLNKMIVGVKNCLKNLKNFSSSAFAVMSSVTQRIRMMSRQLTKIKADAIKAIDNRLNKLRDINYIPVAEWKGDNFVPWKKVSSEGASKDSTLLEDWLDKLDKNADSWLTEHGLAGTDEIGAAFLWMSKDDDGVYHAKTNAWQQIGGYNYLYDEAFDYGTSMDAKYFDFTYDERKFRVWAWKGDYINLGAGAEIGIYSKTSGILGLVDVESPFEDHWLVDTNLAIPMMLNLIDNEKHVISDYRPTEEQWWITSFNPSHKDVEASNLTATYTMTFSTDEYHKEMYEAFREEWEGMNDNLTFDNYTVRFKF